FHLGQPLVPEQVEDFSFGVRKVLDLLVELAPSEQRGRFSACRLRTIAFWGLIQPLASIRMVPDRCSFGSEVVPHHVDQFPANLCGGETVELPCRFWFDRCQRAMQAEDSVL